MSQRRACSGIYVEGNLFDCGFGVLTNLRKAGIPMESIDRVFITHAHSDHTGDFTGLIWAMGLEGRRKKALRVICSGETASALKRVMELQATPQFTLSFEIDFGEPVDTEARFCITNHIPTNYAYRIEVRGKAITYTGDTAPCKEVVELARGSDLLIHDSTYLSDKESLGVITKHSTARQAATVARDARVRRLALTHILPGYSDADYEKEAREVKGVDFIVATDLLKIVI